MAVADVSQMDLLLRFAVALGIGGLIGLERERHHDRKTVVAGVRTMPITAMAGVLVTVLAAETGSPLLLPAALLVMGALAYSIAPHPGSGGIGMTTSVTFVAAFLLGVLAGTGRLLLTGTVGLVITLLLFYKDYLHRMAGVLTEDELRGALYFSVFAFILLPVAPSEAVDPWGIVAPRKVILIVVLVSGLTFLGFLVMRRFGAQRGLPITGLLGGLVSSVAAAGALVSMPTRTAAMRHAVARGVLLATASMVGRNLAIAALADPSLGLAKVLALPLVAMTAVLAIGAMWMPGARSEDDDGPAEGESDVLAIIRSPFALRPAIQFGLLFLLLSFAAFLLRQIPGVGESGVYLTALGGLVSSGAVVASMALLWSQGDVSLEAATVTSLLAVVVSLGVKMGIARRGGTVVGRTVAGPVVVAILVAVGAAVWRAI